MAGVRSGIGPRPRIGGNLNKKKIIGTIDSPSGLDLIIRRVEVAHTTGGGIGYAQSSVESACERHIKTGILLRSRCGVDVSDVRAHSSMSRCCIDDSRNEQDGYY